MSRPKRLWAVFLVNVATGLITLAACGFLLAKSLPFARVLIFSFAPTIVLCAVLIASSIVAFIGSGRSRWIALGTAILFFGSSFIQGLWSYYHPTPPLQDMSAIAPSIERNALCIVLNLWGFLSEKTDAFVDTVASRTPRGAT